MCAPGQHLHHLPVLELPKANRAVPSIGARFVDGRSDGADDGLIEADGPDEPDVVSTVTMSVPGCVGAVLRRRASGEGYALAADAAAAFEDGVEGEEDEEGDCEEHAGGDEEAEEEVAAMLYLYLRLRRGVMGVGVGEWCW